MKKRPEDPMLLAKQVADEAIGDARGIDPAALRAYMQALGKMGGKRGGKNRMKALSAKEKSALGTAGAKARWAKKKP